jgi:hypothetical protein
MTGNVYDVKALITGGSAIGSNLPSTRENGRRSDLGGCLIPEYGGNLFNIETVRNQVTVNFGDIATGMPWIGWCGTRTMFFTWQGRSPM